MSDEEIMKPFESLKEFGHGRTYEAIKSVIKKARAKGHDEGVREERERCISIVRNYGKGGFDYLTLIGKLRVSE